ncbi:Uncharacterised protein [Arcanobacterium haemolyticum]|uniref:LssY-like C-terminal domain-containing protein n=2 Tax=Arcanobacterium haemolyticum TaxID=28264 RepID=D7BPL1_ARCHD|nr:conserved hypothetical protein [Arcanobacterium haemolyticum DSM 20595]SQH28391.1 Uncharacterised protein [Arcanobacterium haemolyticum]
MSLSYPRPSTPPIYSASAYPSTPSLPRRSFSQFIAAAFFVIALLCGAWLMVLIAFHITHGAWFTNLIIFWGVLTYLVLPRLHQIFTFLYVPDYFIGRTRTNDGVLGDPINLAFDGSAEDLCAAMEQAGWVRADPITIRSTIGIIMSTLKRSSYPSAPVSDLNLFGRKQTYAFQQDVGGNAIKRHHIRFWHVPHGWRLPGGEKVSWVAAATYDRSVGLNFFTLQVTHKIDAHIDAERDYVINTLRYADPSISVRVIKNFSTAYHSWNGGGDPIYTDGHMPIVDVRGTAQRNSYSLPPKKPHSHAIPPAPLWFSTILVGLLVTNAIAMMADGNPLGWTPALSAALTSVILLFTFQRKRWAWLLFMTYSTLLCVAALLSITTFLPHDETSFVVAALSVLVLVTISDEKVRRWVNTPRKTR